MLSLLLIRTCEAAKSVVGENGRDGRDNGRYLVRDPHEAPQGTFEERRKASASKSAQVGEEMIGL